MQEYRGYLGKSVTLPCVGFVSNEAYFPINLEWRKCLKTCPALWPTVALVRISDRILTLERYNESLTDNRFKVTSSSADLRISKLNKDDEGYYMCVWQNNRTMPLHLTLGMYSIFAAFTPLCATGISERSLIPKLRNLECNLHRLIM